MNFSEAVISGAATDTGATVPAPGCCPAGAPAQ